MISRIATILGGFLVVATMLSGAAAQQAVPTTDPPNTAPPVVPQPAAPAAIAPAPAVSPAQPPPVPAILPAEQVAPTELTGLLGYAVVGPRGSALGRIVDVLLDKQGRLRGVVVDVGGFMGVGNRKVAVAWNALRFAGGDKGPVITIMIEPERIKAWADYIPGRSVAILGAPIEEAPGAIGGGGGGSGASK